jgi:hypothetical protein
VNVIIGVSGKDSMDHDWQCACRPMAVQIWRGADRLNGRLGIPSVLATIAFLVRTDAPQRHRRGTKVASAMTRQSVHKELRVKILASKYA